MSNFDQYLFNFIHPRPLGSTLFMLRHLLPSLVKFGSAKFWRKLFEWAPSRRLKLLRYVVDLMDNASKSIYHQKVELMGRSDFSQKPANADGIDIMTMLSEFNNNFATIITRRQKSFLKLSRIAMLQKRIGFLTTRL